jgi:phosphonate transport system substrate-binding protein
MLHRADAGGGVHSTLGNQPPDVQAKLRILYETPPMMPHPLSAHPRVPRAVREALVRAILEMDKTPSGSEYLTRLQLSSPQPADQRRDYQPLEQLHLEKYVVTTQ